jgi:hypothetical protein
VTTGVQYTGNRQQPSLPKRGISPRFCGPRIHENFLIWLC